MRYTRLQLVRNFQQRETDHRRGRTCGGPLLSPVAKCPQPARLFLRQGGMFLSSSVCLSGDGVERN